MMKKSVAFCLMIALLASLFAACGAQSSAPEASAASAASRETAASAAESVSSEAVSEEASEEPAPEPEASEEPQEPEEAPAEDSQEALPEPSEEIPAGPVTVTFSDGQTFEATIGEDFVFFFQCDAPGDMGAPAEGEEGAGITVSDGEVTYSHVGLGGPYRYPTSELVTVSGFTGDFEITICEEATFMDATYTIYTDEKEIEDAIAFADYMAAQQAANPMPGEAPPG